MKIVVVSTGLNDELPSEARLFLPKLIRDLNSAGDEIHLFENGAADAETAPALAKRLNELNPDVYFIWDAEEIGWSVLPLLNPSIATLAVAHADSESFYAPVRHYRSFLTRVVGVTPETCVGLVLSCVIDKERVEWISYNELEGSAAESAEEDIRKVIETYRLCFEKAMAEARAVPRQTAADFPPVKTSATESQSWFGKLKAKILN